jgi:hypothetical protein
MARHESSSAGLGARLERRIPSPEGRTARVRTRRSLAAAACALVLLFGTSCSDGSNGDAAHVNRVRVMTSEHHSSETTYAFELPETMPAGATRLSLVNDGAEPHHAQVFKLDDGKTVDDLTGALATGDPSALRALGSFQGGTAIVPPGATSRADAVLELDAGDYALLCFVEDAGGVPHLAHGMVRGFAVTGEDPNSAPEADADAELSDYHFSMPDAIAGDALVRIRNASTAEPHEMVVARLHDGAGSRQVLDALGRGEPIPAVEVGGMQAIGPGSDQYLQLDLQPGRYVVVCYVPAADGKPHYAHGMIDEVTIT